MPLYAWLLHQEHFDARLVCCERSPEQILWVVFWRCRKMTHCKLGKSASHCRSSSSVGANELSGIHFEEMFLHLRLFGLRLSSAHQANLRYVHATVYDVRFHHSKKNRAVVVAQLVEIRGSNPFVNKFHLLSTVLNLYWKKQNKVKETEIKNNVHFARGTMDRPIDSCPSDRGFYSRSLSNSRRFWIFCTKLIGKTKVKDRIEMTMM